MIGYQEVSAMVYIIGLLLLVICLMMVPPAIVIVLIIGSIVFTFFSMMIPNYLISLNRLQPLINKIQPENQVVWVRITKNGLLTFQVAKKGVYGQTKGIIHGYKADVIDKGDFPIRTICGNTGMLVFDMSSHNVNPQQAVGWKHLFKKHKVGTGKDAYLKSQGRKHVEQ